MSAVGFDAEKIHAMACVGHICGWGCGAGRCYFLDKTEGEWRVTLPEGLAQECTWVSSGKD